MSEPSVPYLPRTVADQRVRWPQAVLRVWDYTDTLRIRDETETNLPRGLPRFLLDGDRPGVHEENILDFFDGLRLIVSTDRYGVKWPDFLHVSASVRADTQMFRRLKGVHHPLSHFCEVVRLRCTLFGADLSLAFHTVPAYIPHFFSPKLPQELMP